MGRKGLWESSMLAQKGEWVKKNSGRDRRDGLIGQVLDC